MHLDGVVPNVDTYFRAMFASMQARRLGDALFFWEDMRKYGILPDVSSSAQSPLIVRQAKILTKCAGLLLLTRCCGCSGAVVWRYH